MDELEMEAENRGGGKNNKKTNKNKKNIKS
jgi:hypothetical protein